MSDSFVSSWTVARPAPLSMGLPRQEYRSGLPFPSPRDLPDPGIKTLSAALAGKFFITEPPRKPEPIFRELSFGTLPFRNALLYSLEAYIQSQVLSIWHYSHLSVVYLEMKSGTCYDHVNSQTGHKEAWQLVGEALVWFVALLLSFLVVIINNKLPKHNEVVTDNRKSIMHENIPVIYWYRSTVGLKACSETTFED